MQSGGEQRNKNQYTYTSCDYYTKYTYHLCVEPTEVKKINQS